MVGHPLFALYILFFFFFQSSRLVRSPIPFRGNNVVIFFYFFNQYQVGPTALLNNVNTLNSQRLLQAAAWYWDFFFFFFVFCAGGAKMVFQVIQLKKFGSSAPPSPPFPSAPASYHQVGFEKVYTNPKITIISMNLLSFMNSFNLLNIISFSFSTCGYKILNKNRFKRARERKIMIIKMYLWS